MSICGTTNTGAIDPVRDLRVIADREGMWLHADAAYGGGMLLSHQWPARNRGWNLADSITIDPHKWFYAPLDAGAILVKDDRRLTASFGMKPSYLTDELDRANERYQYYVHSFEQSRRFRGLKVWMSFKRYGAKQIGEWIDNNVSQAKHLYGLVAKHPEFEAASDPPMSAICIRYCGAGLEAVRNGQKLLMGPWPHAVNTTRKLGTIDFGPAALIDLEGYELRWFDHWLKGTENGVMAGSPVRIFLMGKNEWQDQQDWPLPGTQLVKYYLQSGGRANSLFGSGAIGLQPAESDPPDHYRYDPANPVPFIMESSYAQLGGPDDYRPVERRDDVLVYTSEALETPQVICGPVHAHLNASSSATDTDFMVKLLDVWPDGFAQRLNDGMVRARYRSGGDKPSLIEPGKIYGFDIDAWNTCQEFDKGHRIRVEVTSSAFPKYDRNQNTGEPLGKTANINVAQQTIYHDAAHPSYVILPIVPGSK